MSNQTRPRWKKGPPNKPGYWLIEESTRDVVAWLVEWDRDDKNDGTQTLRYLRGSDGISSESVETYHKQWPIRRSYGPIPKPRKERTP